jgi:hypothetical protein
MKLLKLYGVYLGTYQNWYPPQCPDTVLSNLASHNLKDVYTKSSML